MSMINLGLSRISRLLILSPTKQTWKAIHIAGTNGKGSVSSYLSCLLQRLGSISSNDAVGSKQEPLKIGKFTSPHLIDRWDCITINDEPVEKKLFETIELEVQQRAERVKKELLAAAEPHQDGGNKGSKDSDTTEQDATVTSFEMLTATAFEIFSQQMCHVAIIECGLGGRLDATNALKPDEVAVSVITRIGLDHQGLLGDTVEEIATEKAGIAKPGVPLVLDEANEKAIKEAVKSEVWNRDAGPVVESDIDALRAFLSSAEFPNFDPPNHQMENFATASTVLQEFRKRVLVAASENTRHEIMQQITIAEENGSLLRDVFLHVQKNNSGRLQTLETGWAEEIEELKNSKWPILLDGAHNAQSAHVLREYVDTRLLTEQNMRGVYWIIAMSKGKNAKEILGILIKPEDLVIFCEFGPVDGMPWVKPMPTKSLSEVMEQIDHGQSIRAGFDNIYQALKWVDKLAKKPSESETHDLGDEKAGTELEERSMVIAGSLYLVSDFHRLLRDGVEYFCRPKSSESTPVQR